MSLPLAILSSIALMADSIEATPHFWVDMSRRAVDETEKTVTPVTKKEGVAAAAAADNETTSRFSNSVGLTSAKKTSAKPTTTTKKASASKAPSAKPSSAKPSASVTTPAPTSNPVIPPLVVPVASSSNTISNTPVPTSASATNGGGVSGGAIGGIVAAVVIIIAGAVAYFVIRRKKINKDRMQNRSTKPDPFTMGYGSDQAFHSQPMQQQANYQHQYGVQNNSPTSPTSPTYYNNNSNMQFTDANNHIIAEPMMATATAAAVSQQSQQYQPQTNQQYQPQTNQQYQPQANQQYQPQANQQYQSGQDIQAYNTQMYEQNTSMDLNHNVANNVPAAAIVPIAAATAVAATAPVTNGGLLAPTQAGSVGVFHVAATYTPTLSDEIDIQTGDQVEVLVEYDDGWCQGINLSRGNAKGVFPKHCIDFASGASVASSIDRVKRVSSMYIA